jgi:predicted dehydrogenase
MTNALTTLTNQISATPLRVGIAGCALGRLRYGAALSALPECEVVGLADADEREAKAWSRELRTKPPVFETLSALLEATPDLDAVLLASSLRERAEQIGLAGRLGKAILCEVPFGATLAETDAALQEAQHALIMPVFPRRFDPHLVEMTELAADGALGALRQARGEWSVPAAGVNPIEGDAGDGWHALLQYASCQALDLCSLWMGDSQAISADVNFTLHTGMRPTLGRSAEHLATLLVTNATGNSAIQINRIRATTPSERYTLSGTKGHLEWTADGGTARPTTAAPTLLRYGAGAKPERVAVDAPDNVPNAVLRMHHLLCHFIDCVQGADEAQFGAKEARAAQEAAHAAYLAAQEENKVSLPLRRSVDLAALLKTITGDR